MTEPHTVADMPQPGGVPLDRPFRSAPIGEAVRRYRRKYATFSGRASRSEFWWWWITSFAVALILQLVGDVTTGSRIGESVLGGSLFVVWALLTLVGNLAVGARRLHDVNLSGWWQLLHLVLGIGSLVLFVMMLLPERPQGSRFDLP